MFSKPNDMLTLEENALNVLDQTGLTDLGWTFRWNSQRSNAGMCKYNHKRIEVSAVIAEYVSPESTWNTVLHEVAHALAGPYAGHGPTWQKICKDLGGSASVSTVLDGEVAERFTQSSRWVGKCPNDSSHRTYRNRLTKQARRIACGECSPSWQEENIYIWTRNDLYV